LEDRIEKEKELLDLLESRHSIYSFLARIYEREVTVDFLKECSAKDSPLLQMAGIEDLEKGELKRGFEELASYVRTLGNRDLAQAKLELDVEYASLFLGVVVKTHPSESAYSSGHLIMGKLRDEVLFEYRKEGVDKINEFTEPEDHIAIELQFMAYLCRKTREALEQQEWGIALKCLDAQRKFLEKHLISWAPKLTRVILDNSNVDFYRGAARITSGFLEIESDSLAELIRYTSTKVR
jgi:TorA maturation chaperone TorD